MSNTIWKTIVGYSDFEVSDSGAVMDKRTGELKPQVWNGNFLCLNLIDDNGVRSLCKVHRLVALTFIPNLENSHNVIHIDGDRSNNQVNNLMWKPKKVKVHVEKEVKTIRFLDKDYTYEEFCNLSGCELPLLKSRLRSGWTPLECFTGVKEFKGVGYEDGEYWYPTKTLYEDALVKRKLEDIKLKKEDERKRKAQKKAERDAKIHYGFGVFVNYPIKGIIDRKVTRAYYVWQGIISRCYNESHDSYSRYGGRGCTVSLKWKHFQDFAVWYEAQLERGMGNAHVSWHVDKDILFNGNLEYGPDTCCFVPDEVNIFFASLSEDVKGCTFNKGTWVAALSISGKKHQRVFRNEKDATTWYSKGKTHAAQLLLWKYEGLLDERVVERLSKI